MAPRTAAVQGFTLTEGRHPAGSSLPWHTHPGPTLCFVFAGAFTESFRGATLECVPGTLKVTPAVELHSNRFGRHATEGLLVEADPARLDRLGSSGSVLAERRSVRDAGLATLAWRLRGELRRTDTAAPLAIEGLVLEIVAGAARERELRVSGGAPRWLAAARDCLHDATWTGGLGELASEVGVHPVTLARGFRRAYGCSVGEYLRLVRVSRANRTIVEKSQPSSSGVCAAAGSPVAAGSTPASYLAFA